MYGFPPSHAAHSKLWRPQRHHFTLPTTYHYDRLSCARTGSTIEAYPA